MLLIGFEISFSFFWLGTMSFTVWNTFRHLKATKVLLSLINQSNILQSFKWAELCIFHEKKRYIIAATSKSTFQSSVKLIMEEVLVFHEA